PTFRRLALTEWVTSEAYLRRGWMDVGDFSDPAFIKRLADASPGNAAFRQSIFQKFRNPRNQSDTAYLDERLTLPYMMGDGVNYNGSPLQWFQFPELQYSHLEAWARGDFTNDRIDTTVDAVNTLDDIDLALQPAALTEAALEPCSGGAFHPGVEL